MLSWFQKMHTRLGVWFDDRIFPTKDKDLLELAEAMKNEPDHLEHVWAVNRLSHSNVFKRIWTRAKNRNRGMTSTN
jgi:hypothetical protein